MFEYGKAHRIVTHKSRNYIVESKDLDRGSFSAWEVVAYGPKFLKVKEGKDALLTFASQDVVESRKILDLALALKMFTEHIESHPGVAKGTHMVKRSKSTGIHTVVKNPGFGPPSAEHFCRTHGCPMHQRRLPNGGIFYGCEMFKLMGCKETVGADGRYRPGTSEKRC